MRRLSRATVTIAIITVLVVSAMGVGAAAPGTADPHSEADTDDPFGDVSSWFTPGEDRLVTTDGSMTTDVDTTRFAQDLIDDVLSSLFDTSDGGDDDTAGDDGDSSEDDTAPEDDDAADEDADDGDGDGAEDGSSEPTDDGEDIDGVEDGGDDKNDDTEEGDSSGDTDDGSETDDADESEDEDDADDGASESDDGESETDDDADGDDAGDDSTDADDTDDTGDADGETGEDDADESDDGTLDRALVERYVHEAVNEERTARGLEALEFDTGLQEIARSHSEDMAERDYFAHEDPDGNSFEDRYADHGYECRAYTDDGYYYTGGENIAYTYFDQPVRTDSGETVHYTTERELADGIVDQWMNSDGHRENLLASHWNNEGIGIYVTDENRVYATQNFC